MILSFDTVRINDCDSYSLIEVEAIELITNEVFQLTFKASLVNNGYQTNIHDNDITEEVFLKIYDLDINIYCLVKFWTVFKINDAISNIKNYVVRTVYHNYDIYDILFDMDSAAVLDLNIRKIVELKESSVYYPI